MTDSPRKTHRPHVVIFNPDQWRADSVGHLGNPAAQTPVLDEWVEADAVSFGQAYCQNPVCTPSRCSFMTGWYPHVRGHRTMFHMLQPDEPCLLRTLKESGYHVWWGGKNDLVPAQGGFDDYCDVKYVPEVPPRPMFAFDRQEEWRGPPDGNNYYSFYAGELSAEDDGPEGQRIYRDSDWAYIEGAIAAIEGRPTDRPLCLYLPLTYPHPPYGVEQPWFSAIDRDALPPRVPPPDDWAGKPSILPRLAENFNLGGWDASRWDELRATYLGMGSRVDYQFGLLLDALRRAGIYDDTAIFFFSDHGDFTGDYDLVEKTQNTFEDCLTRVPLLVKPPKGHPVAPRVTDGLVELIDVPATIEDWCGLPRRHTHFGRSLGALVAGETDTGRDAVFCEGGRRADEHAAKELESGPMGEPGALYWPRLSLQQQDGVPCHTRAVMCRTATHKYVRRLDEPDELYDLVADPHELDNRIDDPALDGVLTALRERLLDHLLDTSDVVPLTPDRRT